MRFFTRLVALTMCLLLTACSHMLQLPTPGNQSSDRSHDTRFGIWIGGAKASVWARLQTLEPQSALVQSLVNACSAGKQVEVLTWVSSQEAAMSMRGTCLRIWVTNHPDVARFPDTLLVDSDTLVIQGNLDDFQGARARNEYHAQANVKRHDAQRVN